MDDQNTTLPDFNQFPEAVNRYEASQQQRDDNLNRFSDIEKGLLWLLVLGAGSALLLTILAWSAGPGGLGAALLAIFIVLGLTALIPTLLVINLIRIIKIRRQGQHVSPSRYWLFALILLAIPLPVLLFLG